MEISEKIINHCKMEANMENLSDILIALGINNYITFCELKKNDFIRKCEKYLKNKEKDIKPGESILLQKIGEVISQMSEKEFKENFEEHIQEYETEKKTYPLLDELNKQLKQNKYSDTLKDVSVLLRLNAGRQVHQFLSDNLPMPKTSSTDKYLKDFDYVNEGELQVSKSTIFYYFTLALQAKRAYV